MQNLSAKGAKSHKIPYCSALSLVTQDKDSDLLKHYKEVMKIREKKTEEKKTLQDLFDEDCTVQTV